MDLFIGIIIGVFLGRWVQSMIDAWAMRSVLKDLGVTQRDLDRMVKELEDRNNSDQSQQELPEVQVKIEECQGILYAFRVDNDQFLGQGTDPDALIASIRNNLTNVRVTILKEHGADLIKS